MIEEWRTIPEWDAYEVSTLGRVRRKKSKRIRAQQPTTSMKYLTVNLSL